MSAFQMDGLKSKVATRLNTLTEGTNHYVHVQTRPLSFPAMRWPADIDAFSLSTNVFYFYKEMD